MKGKKHKLESFLGKQKWSDSSNEDDCVDPVDVDDREVSEVFGHISEVFLHLLECSRNFIQNVKKRMHMLVLLLSLQNNSLHQFGRFCDCRKQCIEECETSEEQQGVPVLSIIFHLAIDIFSHRKRRGDAFLVWEMTGRGARESTNRGDEADAFRLYPRQYGQKRGRREDKQKWSC